jgi:hypothetical protein
VAPPHRSNRISQSKVDNTGLQQNYRRWNSQRRK